MKPEVKKFLCKLFQRTGILMCVCMKSLGIHTSTALDQSNPHLSPCTLILSYSLGITQWMIWVFVQDIYQQCSLPPFQGMLPAKIIRYTLLCSTWKFITNMWIRQHQ